MQSTADRVSLTRTPEARFLTIGARLAETAATLFAATLALRTTFFGRRCKIGRKVTLAVNLATANPYLHAKHTNLGVSLDQCIVDIGAESVERSATLLEHL